MKEILKLREKILKQDYLNSDIMKITEAISILNSTNKKLSRDTKMKNEEKDIVINQEVKNVKNLIAAYTKKNRTVPWEILQLELVINKFLKDIALKSNKTIIL